jgi:transposase
MSRYDLTDFEWRVIEPLLPNKPRGVTRVDDRRVRWRKAGVWDRLMDAITVAHDGDIQMIDSTSVRVHQQAATAKRGVQITVSVAPGAEAEVLPPRRYPLRQARRQLPRHDPTRLDAAVAPSL